MKYFYITSYLLFLTLSILFLKEAKKDYLIKKENNIVDAVVKSVPEYCLGSSSNIDLIINSKTYTASIVKRACINDVYTVNQKIKIYYSNKYDDVVMLFKATKFDYNLAKALFIFLIFFLFPLFWRLWLNWDRMLRIRRDFHLNKTDEEVRDEIKKLKKRLS